MARSIVWFLFALGLPLAATDSAAGSTPTPCASTSLVDALSSTEARFVVLRHEKKGPDRRAGLDPRVRQCQKRWRGSDQRDLRVLLQEGGVIDAGETRDHLDSLLRSASETNGASAAELRLAPTVFHSRYCRSLETAIAMLRGDDELVEVATLDLGSGALRAALAEAQDQLGGEPGPALIITHKDRFEDIGLESPAQGGGYVLDAESRCLAKVPAR